MRRVKGQGKGAMTRGDESKVTTKERSDSKWDRAKGQEKGGDATQGGDENK